MGASNAGGIGRNRVLSQYLASSHAVNRSSGKCNKLAATDHGEFITLVSCKRQSLMMAGNMKQRKSV